MKEILSNHIETIKQLGTQLPKIAACVEVITACIANGGKILLCGNGGSASDAQHIAAELSGKFYKHRAPIDAEALHVNSAYLTAVANDLGFEKVYCRALRAKGKKGDVLIAISTSGNSTNVIEAIKKANSMHMTTIALTGTKGQDMIRLCDHAIVVASEDTPRIQEAHILIGHILCEKVEQNLFP